MAYINGKQILNLSAAINGVASVNGKTGNVVLTAADIESDNGTVEESLQNILSRLDGGVRTAFNTADVDLNTYTDAGWWYTGMDTTVTNAPIEDIEDFELIVMKTQGAAMQFFFFPGQSLIYCRNDPYGTGSWGSWEKIITEQFVDSALSTTSTNPVQNKVVAEKINSANSTITSINSALETKVTREVAVVGSDEANSAGWYKVADGTVYPNTDVSMLFAVHSTEGTKSAGILQLNLRSTSSTTTCQQFGWLVRNGFNPNNLIIATDGRSWTMYFKVLSTQYYRTFFEVIQKSSTNSSTLAGGYALYTDSVVETTEPTATYTSADLGVIKTINEKLDKKADTETGTCTLTAYSDTVFGGTVSNEILLNWESDTSKYYTTGSVNADGTLAVTGTGNARIINAYNINATGTVGVEFEVSGTGAIKIEIKGGGKTYTSGNISLSTTTQKIQITHATSGIAVLDDMEINIYASGETALTIENLLKITEASTRTLTGNYELIGNQVTVSVFVDNLQNGGEIALYPLPFVPKIAKSGVCGAFSASSYSAIYYDIDGGTTAMIYLNDAPQANKQLTFYYTV